MGYTVGYNPRFRGVVQSVLRKEIDSLLRKEAISVVPPEEADSGFHSRYFLVPKKDGAIGQY